MQIQACPLIVALLAFLSYLPATTTATSRVASARSAGGVPILHVPPKEAANKKISRLPLRQQPNTVNIRPRVAAAQQGVPTVQITVDKSRVPVNETVVFTLTPGSVVSDARYVVTIDFDDGSPRSVTRQTEIVHQYGAPGIYTVTVSVKSAGSSPNPGPDPRVPRVSLFAAPTTVEAGRPVTFTARLSFSYPDIKYRFVFGDGIQTDWQDKPETTHAYLTANRYQAYVDIGGSTKGAVKQMGGSTRQPIQVTQPPVGAVDLIAEPSPVEAGRSVNFTARIASRDPNTRYRFFFGDSSPSSGWQNSPQTTHTYPVAGIYPAYVQIGLYDNGPISMRAASSPRPISVTPLLQPGGPSPAPSVAAPSPAPGTPSPTPSRSASSPSPGDTTSPTPDNTSSSPVSGTTDSNRGFPFGPVDKDNWWKWLLIALIVLVVGYQAAKMILAPRLTVRSYMDSGVSALEQEKEPLELNFQLLLSPNVSEGSYFIESPETDFIRSERRSNG
jgi:PKD repeat protein